MFLSSWQRQVAASRAIACHLLIFPASSNSYSFCFLCLAVEGLVYSWDFTYGCGRHIYTTSFLVYYCGSCTQFWAIDYKYLYRRWKPIGNIRWFWEHNLIWEAGSGALCSFEISSMRTAWTCQSERGVPRMVKGLENTKSEQKWRTQRRDLTIVSSNLFKSIERTNQDDSWNSVAMDTSWNRINSD